MKQFYTALDVDNKGYYDIFYLVDLHTKRVITRVDDDSKSLDKLKEEVEFYNDKYELEVVQAIRWELDTNK